MSLTEKQEIDLVKNVRDLAFLISELTSKVIKLNERVGELEQTVSMLKRGGRILS